MTDTIRELPDGLTWAQSVKTYGDAALKLWSISGRISANDVMTPADRSRLSDAIKQTSVKETKEENTMTLTNEAADIAMLTDAEQREYLLAAAKHRSRLQQSDTENLFDIAARLRKTVEAARAADAVSNVPKQ